MATQWILDKVSDALAPTVQNACSTAGSYAGGAITYVGTGINGVGEKINTNIRYYGDGAMDYANSIMDWSSAPGVRSQTASNPLGLSDTKGGGKAKATAPSIYRAAPAMTSKNTTTTTTKPSSKKITAAPKPGGTVVAPKPKPKPKVEPVKKTVPAKSTNLPTKALAPSSVGNKAKAVTSKVGPTAVKATPAVIKPPSNAAPKTKKQVKNSQVVNPLGLKKI